MKKPYDYYPIVMFGSFMAIIGLSVLLWVNIWGSVRTTNGTMSFSPIPCGAVLDGVPGATEECLAANLPEDANIFSVNVKTIPTIEDPSSGPTLTFDRGHSFVAISSEYRTLTARFGPITLHIDF